MMTTLIAAIGIVAVALGCGGDDDSSSADAAGDSLGKAAFVKQANEACLEEREDSFEQVAAYQKKHRGEGGSQEEQMRRAIRAVLLSTIAAEIADLEALGMPEGDEQQVEAILASLEDAHEEAEEQTKTDPSKEVEDYFGAANKKLAGYGLESCQK